jgi:FtsH-binding integral membrane protein
MTTALVLFALAALGGLTMAVMRFRGAERPPTGLALAHGGLAAAGLIALIVAVTGPGVPGQARTALVVFLVAALGGFYLFAQHMQKKALPIPFILVHGLIAVVGFLILLVIVIHP